MQRMVEIDGWTVEYELTYKQVKNLNLRIRSDGQVAVSAPYGVTPEAVDSFVSGQEELLRRALSRVEHSAVARDFYLGEGGTIPIFGRRRRLTVRQGSPTGAELYEERLVLTVADPDSEEQIRAALRQELGRLAQKSLPVVCFEAAKRLMGYDIPKPTLRYRCMVGKWGSCCPSRGEITFNKFLVCASPECIEYVATHELAHFQVLNHSPEFHRLMDELMPDWRARKKQLAPYGYLLPRL